jgi:hypothetical protein
MRRNRSWVAAATMVLLIGTGAWAAFDSPAGVGFDFPENKSGDAYSGFVTVALHDYNGGDLTAGSFEAVAQLRRKKELHAFHAEFSCDDAVPACAEVCTEDDRVDATASVAIALCLTELIQPEVLDDFGLDAALDVRLHSASEFVSEVDPSDATVRVVAATIEVTVK